MSAFPAGSRKNAIRQTPVSRVSAANSTPRLSSSARAAPMSSTWKAIGCVLTANVGLPHASIREAVALAIHLVVHLARVDGRRRVTGMQAVRGYDTATDRFLVDTILSAREREGVHV